jgi:hypothetical protein
VNTLKYICLAAAVGGLSATACAGQEFAYAVDTNESLYLLSLDTVGATFDLVGNTGVFLEGLAVSPDGDLYGIDSGANLYAVDKTNGSASLIGSTGLGSGEGLDFNGNTLLMSDFSAVPNIYSLDLGDATPTLVSTFGDTNTSVIRSFAVRSADQITARCDAPGPNSLYSEVLSTGATTHIGEMGGDIFAAIDYGANGSLYAMDDDGTVYRVDDTTGATTLLGDTGDNFWLGMACIGEVPEPASITVLAAGALLLLARRRK